MKPTNKCPIAVSLGLMLSHLPASAGISIQTVPVGNAGSGGVGYDYRIGTYEVTNREYGSFLNAVAKEDPHGLWNPWMNSRGISRNGSSGSYTYSVSSTAASEPVRAVSFWDAARFSNWLTNGQPIGGQDMTTTESGAYLLGGVSTPENTTVVRLLDFARGDQGVAVAGRWEWEKAAYYNPATNDYWTYATRSDSAPFATGPNSSNPNSANYASAVGTVTNVGSYSLATSEYGTYDQSGNVWEIFDSFWNNRPVGELRREGGGSYGAAAVHISNNYGSSSRPTDEFVDLGFRVTSVYAITPEPSVSCLFFGALASLVAVRRRSALTRG